MIIFKYFLPAIAVCFALAICVGWAPSLQADTLYVQQDGSGQFTTIEAALVAAADGDVILVGQGTYHESPLVNKSVTIKSETGCLTTILDGDDSRQIMTVEGMVNVSLEGLTFTHGYASDASALMIWNGATVVVEDCNFMDNYATSSNAVHVRHSGTGASFFNCEFRNNSCELHSAALSIGIDANSLVVQDCIFADNTSQGMSGAVNCNSGLVDFHGNLFLRNSGLGSGALTILYEVSGRVYGNTFHENTGRDHGSVLIAADVTFEQNIVTSTLVGPGLDTNGDLLHSCNLFYDNKGGSIVGSELGEGEIEEDPLYCEYTLDNFFLCSRSPALEANNTCGTMGAYDEGCSECGPIPVEKKTLGDLKSMYR